MRPAADRDDLDRTLYPILEKLDRLEDLLEEMTELGVRSVQEIERRIAELNARVDDTEAEAG